MGRPQGGDRPVIATLIVMQAATPAPDALAAFDLARVPPAPCEADGSAEIVVCGRRDPDRFRVTRLPDMPAEALPRAELGVVGDLKASATVDQAVMPDGTVSKRLMFNLKLPF